MRHIVPVNNGRLRWPWLTGALFLFLFLSVIAWNNYYDQDVEVPLSSSEKAWLQAHPVIRFAPDPDFPPVEFFDDEGTYRGITADYTELIEKKLGIRFEIIHSRDWNELISNVKSGRIDVCVAARTPQRSTHMLFTTPFLKLPIAIIAREKASSPLRIENLSGMMVSVVSGYATHDFIAANHPELRLDVVVDARTGLRKVSFGLSDAFIENLATASYYIEKEGISNLRIAGDTGYAYNLGLCSRKDWPELNRILEKALSSIGARKKKAIYSRWIPLEQRSLLTDRHVQIGLSVTLAALLFAAVGIIAWNRALARQVRQRTGELENELAERRQIENKLRFTQFAIDNSLDPAFWVTEDARVFYVNNAACKALGYSQEELLTMSTHVIDPCNSLEQNAQFWGLLREKGSITIETYLRTKQGVVYPVEIRCNHVIFDGKKYNCAFAIDIGERKRAEKALHRMNRELLAISSCNKILMRAENEQTLLNDICKIVCNEAGYRMAWVGYAESDEAKSVRPIAWAGSEDGYLKLSNITWEDTERGKSPSGTAIRTGESVCIQDFITDPRAETWREEALRRGYRSRIALPLKDDNNTTFGVLNIYSAEPNAFSMDEMGLLEDLAGDLAFGITVLRTRLERKRMREELERTREELERRVEERTTELRKTNETLELEIEARERNEAIILARLRLLQFAGSHNLDELLEATLDEAELLTGSELGLYLSVQEDQQVLALQSWSSKTKRDYCRVEAKKPQYDISSHAGVWADCIHQQCAIIHNDYASEAHGKELPPGHAPLVRELVVPVFRDNNIVAILAVGNKSVNYTTRDVETVTLLADLAWEISVKKRLEEELHLSHFCINKAGIAIYHTTHEGDILDANEFACNSLGYTLAELCQLKVKDIDPVITEEKFRIIGDILDQTGTITHESVHRRKDGSTFPVEIATNTMEYRGKTYGISFIKDISERQRTEKALRDASLVVENSPVVLFRWKNADDWPVELVSGNIKQFGYSPEDFLVGHLSYAAIIHRDDLERRTGEVHAFCTSGADQFSLEYRIITRSGQVRWVNEHSNIERDEFGTVRNFEGIVIDITERKLAGNEILESRAKYQAIVDSLDGFIYISSPDYRISFMNKKLIERTGREALGEFCYHILHELDEPCPWCVNDRVFKGETVHQEVQSPKDNRWYYAVNVPIQDADGTRLKHTMIFDITDRKLFEEELQKRKRTLQDLNATLEKRVEEEVDKNREKDIMLIQQNRQAALGEMLDHIAHQWKQPLNSISLIANDLSDGSSSGDITDEDIQATVAKIMSLVDHMAQTIDIFRNFHRPDKKKKLFNIKESVDQAIAFVAPAFRFQSIIVELDVDPALTAFGSPKEFTHVLLNILVNASDAFKARKSDNPRVVIRAYEEHAKTVVTIADNAGGIPKAIINKIFDFHFTTNKGSGGTGIGLYMCKNIIEKNMGGSLAVDNLDEGAQFRIAVSST